VPDRQLPRLPDDRIPIAGPWITEHEIARVEEAVRTCWYEGAGRFTTQFEREFADYLGRRHAISLPSCTSGMHLSLAALGLGPGDEVIVPQSTWIATSAPVSYVGATPVFVDIDPGHWCLDVDAVRAAITDRTRAVVAVDLYGGVPEYDALEVLCAEHGLALVEDAAQAVGAEYHGRRAGTFGAASVFSFHTSKTITTSEGGMVVTDDDELHARMMFLRDHGRLPGDYTFFNSEVAFKYKMSELQAALGLAQLERVAELVERKRSIFGWYRDRLADVDGLTLNAERPGTLNTFWMATVVADSSLGVTERTLAAALDDAGIATRPFFHPLSSLPAYADLAATPAPHPVADRCGTLGINLPSALLLTEDHVDIVCRALRRVLAAERRHDTDLERMEKISHG